MLPSLASGPLLVDVVQAPGFYLTVNESACKTSQDLFGLRVAGGLSVLSYVLLVCFGGLVRCCASNELMGQTGLVWGIDNLVVAILVGRKDVEDTHDYRFSEYEDERCELKLSRDIVRFIYLEERYAVGVTKRDNLHETLAVASRCYK